MKRTHFGILTRSALLLLNADTGTPTGGAALKADAEPKTLAEALAALATCRATETANADALATAQANLAAVTTERDNLQAQFNTATEAAAAANTNATKAAADLTAAQATIGALTQERDQLAAANATAKANIDRLSALCGVKGVDPNAAVPSVETPAADGAALAQQWQDLRAAGKVIEAEAFRKQHAAALNAFAGIK